LKYKLIFGRRQTKCKACGLVLRPKSLVFNSLVKPVERLQELSGQGEPSSKKMPKGSVIEAIAAPLGKMSPAKSWFRQGLLRLGFSSSLEEVVMLSSRPAMSNSTGESPLEECLPSFVVALSLDFALVLLVISLTSTGMIALVSPVMPSTILVVLEAAQSSPAMINIGFVLLGCSQIVPETSLTLVLMGSTQIVSEMILTSTEAASIILSSSELAQIVLVGLSISQEPFGLVIFNEGSKSAPNLAIPRAQLLVNGLIEAQAWFLGWLRDGT
jgi:hypothetical protein